MPSRITTPPRPLPTLIALLGALALLVLAACGASSGVSATAAAGAASKTATASAAATAAATPPASCPPGTPTGEVVASTAAIPASKLPVGQFTRADGTHVDLPLEVPHIREYGVGLSGRYCLSGRGMLFFYPGAKNNAGFWMKNTHIDLAIAFVDLAGKVIVIDHMRADSLTVHRPPRPYEYAIEAPEGWYAQQRIQAGDTFRPLFSLTAADIQ